MLIADFDFFSTLGGGQTLYQRIVERNPGTDFVYPSKGPDIALTDGRLPPNAVPIPYVGDAQAARLHAAGAGGHWLSRHLVTAAVGIAASVAGRRFDAVDVPSFRPIAHLIRPLLHRFDATADRVVAGLVGWLSTGLSHGWRPDMAGDFAAALADFEQATVAAADLRYGLSSLHLGPNGHRIEEPVVTLDMHDVIEPFRPGLLAEGWRGTRPPDLCYLGRLDRNKGPDLFLRLVASLPRQCYGRVLMAGPDGHSSPDTRWIDHLNELAQSLGVAFDYLGTPDKQAVAERFFRSRSVVVVPSRTDAYNFVVAESLLQGCPTVVSTQAGAFEFFAQRHPNVPLIPFDPAHLTAIRERLTDVLGRYDAHRAALHRALLDEPWPEPRRDFIWDVYGAMPEADGAAVEAGERLAASLMPS